MADYGDDFSCFDSRGRFFVDLGKLITGARVPLENVAKICFTNYGALFWSKTIGINADDLVNARLTDASLPRLAQAFAQEARKVIGVKDARAKVTRLASGGLLIECQVRLMEGTYPLLITLDQAATVLFPGVAANA